MPNYVQNILNIEGDKKEVDKVLKAVSNAYRTFDFERLIPMPRELEIEAGTRTQRGFQHFSIIRNLWENISLKSGTAKR